MTGTFPSGPENDCIGPPPHADLSYIISKRVWREHLKWRGRFMALWRSYRNGGDPEAWYNAHVQVGVEFYKASLGGAA